MNSPVKSRTVIGKTRTSIHTIVASRRKRLAALVASLVLPALSTMPSNASADATAARADGAAPAVYFESHIRPILREYCLDCHGAAEHAEGNLDLRLVRLMKQGGDSGPAIDLETPHLSEVLTQIESGAMPPGEGKVPAEKIELLRRWIEAGAPTLRPEPESIGFGIPLTDEERAYWAYQPISNPQPKTAIDGQKIRTGLDAVLADAMPADLSFSPDAPRNVLIQRLFVDLTGLVPSLAEFEQWSAETDPNWYEKLIDALLASPQYGERWGRHWLDTAGYADSDGATISDAERPWAWRYRDYVIQSFNEDKPFDRFLQEQLAGDEIAGPAQGDWRLEQIESLVATGFLRMAADGTGSGDDSAESRNKTISDTIQIVGSTLLSSSMNCAQCHDHRYDPISHQDYTALRAVFEPALDWQNWKAPAQRLVSLYTQAERDQAAEIEKEAQLLVEEKMKKQQAYIQEVLEAELAKRPEEQRESLRLAHSTAADKRSEEQKLLLEKNPSVNVNGGALYLYRPDAAEDLKKFDERIAAVRAKKPAEGFVQALVEPPNHAPVTKLFHRGDHNSPTREVQPGKLSVLTPEGESTEFPHDDPALPTTGRRLALAKWLTQSETPNPLLLRSLVNRIWLQHFGKGIVATPGDFGVLGATPSNVQVLDWLATHWIEEKWSLKKLHKAILLSSVYRQSSHRREDALAIDPENNLYWRKPIQRIEAEVIRDSLLKISGTLDPTQFGPPLALQEDETGQVQINPDQKRRSIYAKARRSQPVALLQSFDAPVMTINCDIRERSTVPMQSLMLMNGEFSLDQADKLAAKILLTARNQKKASAAKAEQLVEAGRPVSTRSDHQSEFDSAVWSLPSAPTRNWECGVGKLNKETGTVDGYQPFPYFSGNSWQAGEKYPDAKWGFASLNPHGGHPGSPEVAVVRKWTADMPGRLLIEGKLDHASPNGDGVKGLLIAKDSSGKSGIVAEWGAQHGSAPTRLVDLAVVNGDELFFVVDCIANETSDSFTWSLSLNLATEEGKVVKTYDFTKDFQGYGDDYSLFLHCVRTAWLETLLREPTEHELLMVEQFVRAQLEVLHAEPQRVPVKTSAMQLVLANICQMLSSSNEFLYVE